jgi:hypothetical protein
VPRDVDRHSQAIQLTFCAPRIPLADATEVSCEFIFLLDRSGSMEGAPIQNAAACTRLAMRSLPMNSRFNIAGFGGHGSFELLFPEGPRAYSTLN